MQCDNKLRKVTHYCKVAGAGCAVERGEVDNTNESYNLFGLGLSWLFYVFNMQLEDYFKIFREKSKINKLASIC